MPDQTQTGKAFEYALLRAFYDRLSRLTSTLVIETAPYHTARRCFELFGDDEKGAYRLVSSAAVNFCWERQGRPVDFYELNEGAIRCRLDHF